MSGDRVTTFVKSQTGRLTGTYLAIIMLMSIGFSFVFYNTSARQLGRQLPPPSTYQTLIERRENGRAEFDIFLHNRISEGRIDLLRKLLFLNIIAFGAGGMISYYLARRTLQPIEEAMEAQSRFVSDASHELRTPITAIQTTNEVALRKQKLTVPEAKDLIKYNVEEAIKLKTLTDGLLGLLKQDQQSISRAKVSLQDIVSESMNRIVQLASDKKIAINDEVPVIKVFGNAQQLEQAVTILLDNAIKYSPEKSTIMLKAYMKNKHAYLEVKDEGMGIKASDVPHIFERFYRADMSRNKIVNEGYGLGLSIAKKIVEQHNGDIRVESAINKGTMFIIKLPLSDK